MTHKLLPAIFSGVLSHLLFHFIYPSSISVPVILSALLAAFSVSPQRSDPVQVQGISNVVFAFGIYVFAFLFSIVTYRLSPFHPLAKYPGPTIAKVTAIWGAWSAGNGRRHQDLLQLHRTYGPFVRTGPNEISVADVKAVADVLGAGGIPKGEYYTVRKDPSAPNNLLAMTGEEHDNRRRLWNRGMGHDSLQEYEVVIARRGTVLVNRLKTELRRADGVVDLVRWIDYFAFDFMGSMAFGNDFHLMTEGEDKHGVVNLLNEFIHVTNEGAYLPWAMPMFMKYPPFARKVIAFRKLGVDSARARVQAGAKVKDLWYHLSDEAELEKTRPLIANVVADGALAMIAGSDTAATALAAFFYFVLQDSECYKRVREEIDSVYPPGSDPMDASHHEQLIWVKACVNETLRLAPPLPTNGPRQVPYKSQGAMVAGRFVPPGTQVYVPPYVLHRDPRYFSPSPDSFKPSRWLTSDPETGALASPGASGGAILNQLAFIPFSYGPANCVGKGLARLEICMIICALVQKFDFALADGVDQKHWLEDLRDHLVMARGSLWVKVTERVA